jgi:multidrug resistance protein
MKKSSLLILFVVVFLDLVGFGIIMPLLPFLGRKFQADGLEIGLLFASYSFMQFLFAPVWGKISDRIGRRPVILISLLGSTVSYLLLGCASSLEWIWISRIFAGICGANIAVANAYIADITTKENRSKGMGVIGAAFGLGFIFGPVLAGWLGRYGWAVPALSAAGLCGANLVLAFFILPESHHRSPEGLHRIGSAMTHAWQYVLGLPAVAILVLVTFLTTLAFAEWETMFGLFLQRKDALGLDLLQAYSTFIWMLAYTGLIVALIQGRLIGGLVKKFGENHLLLASAALFVIGFFALPFALTKLEIYVALTFLAAGSGLNRPVVYSLISQNVPDGEQGLVFGVVQSAASLARIIGPLVGGKLLDIRLSLPFLFATGLLVISGFASWHFVRLKKVPAGDPIVS